METTNNIISVMRDGMPYRVIGHWRGTSKTYGHNQGVIDYGFKTKEGAVNYLRCLMRIADGNNWSYKRTSETKLEVTFADWSNYKNFDATYQVACYIN